MTMPLLAGRPLFLHLLGPWAALVALLAAAPDASAFQGTSAAEPLVVGTKEAAPFSFRDSSGEWRGISVDLWRAIAEDLKLEFEFKEVPLEELIEGLTTGRLDASVAALTVTPAREEVVDFTHAFHPSGLGIAVRSDEKKSGLLGVLSNLFTIQFLEAVGTLVVVLFLGGAVVWLLERRRNAEQFGGPPA
ncbi:MAG: transporter substrate-binding domain-containing protein, partial [Planctomycetota bacterium]